MKHTTGPRRGRSRGNGKRFSAGGGGGKNQTFESSGPDVKIRGTAQQIHEKYLSLARDAVSAGDRIAAEGFFQFADHYYRLFNAANGNGQPRSDQNNRIPPPPESAAGGFAGGDDAQGGAMAGDGPLDGADDDMAPYAEGEPRRAESYPPQRPADEFRPMRPGEPVYRSRFAETVEEAAPAAQAEELAEALARGDETLDAGSPVDEAPAFEADAPAEPTEENGAQPERRTLGLNLGGRRSLGRRSQRPAEAGTPAEGDGGAAADDVPSAESREGGFLGPKPIRRRVRRINGLPTKPKEPAGTA